MKQVEPTNTCFGCGRWMISYVHKLQYWANIKLEQGAVQHHSDYDHIQSCNQSNKVSLINGIGKHKSQFGKHIIWEDGLKGLCTSIGKLVTRTLIAITRPYKTALVSIKQAPIFLSDEIGKHELAYPRFQELHNVRLNLGEAGNRQSHLHHFKSMILDWSGKGTCPGTGSQNGTSVWTVERALGGSRLSDVSSLN